VADNKLVKVAAVEQPTNGKVTLGENAKLVLPAGVTVGEVASTGGNVGSDLTLADDFVLEVPDLAKPLSVAGTLTLPTIGMFKIDPVIAFAGDRATFVLAEATSVVATDVSAWRVAATPAKYVYRVYVQGNQVVMEVAKPGLMIMIR